jgi:hypothetical protein
LPAVRLKRLQFGDVISAEQINRARRPIVIADLVRHNLSQESFDEKTDFILRTVPIEKTPGKIWRS